MAEAWQARRYAGPWLVDCCGRHVRVVFPGRRWGGPGPDFVGAVLALRDGTLVRGDVEVHCRARAWSGHRHARDPAYAHVVLHVVGRADAVALDAQGRHVPTVELPLEAEACSPPGGRQAPAPGGQWPALQVRALELGPCVRQAPWALAAATAAGWERFRERAARFEGDLALAAPDQVVWRGVAEALGFRRNTRAFAELADAVPWPEAASVVRERGPVALAGLLLGTGGLLRSASLPEAHHFRLLQHEHGARPLLGAARWDRVQLRAANAPAERCRGLAELAARWLEPPGGPAEHVLAAVRAASSARHPRLWRACLVSPWIGRGRAQVIAVNVLVPFAAAAGLGAEAEALWPRLPGEPPNRVVRYMAEQLGSPAIRFRGACLQQGLVHLFKQRCAARVCEHCPARDPGLSLTVERLS